MSGERYAALLRGINVGGKNRLGMQDLQAIFREAGCEEVRTYIQSGNVIFQAQDAALRSLPGLISKEIQERFGLRVPIVLRSAAELAEVARQNPFLKEAPTPNALHVAFLESEPSGAAVSSLDLKHSGADRFQVCGREVYLHLPEGMARTKLTNAYFDTKLRTVSTIRNWATVLKLEEMTRS